MNRAEILSPVRAFLIEAPLAAKLRLSESPRCFDWQHGDMRRIGVWDDHQLLSGQVAEWNARSLAANIEPVIVVRNTLRSREWSECFEGIVFKRVIVLFEDDEDSIASVRDELCSIDAKVLGSWAAFLMYPTVGVRLHRHVPSEAFWVDYGRAVAVEVSDPARLERLSERSPWVLGPVRRNVSSSEFDLKVGHDNVFRLTSAALPFCVAESTGYVPPSELVLSGFYALSALEPLVTAVFNVKMENAESSGEGFVGVTEFLSSLTLCAGDGSSIPARCTLLQDGVILWDLKLQVAFYDQGSCVEGCLLTKPGSKARELILRFGGGATLNLVDEVVGTDRGVPCRAIPHLGNRERWIFTVNLKTFAEEMIQASPGFWVEEVA